MIKHATVCTRTSKTYPIYVTVKFIPTLLRWRPELINFSLAKPKLAKPKVN